MSLLQSKVALVTGAGSGIGRSIAELYASNGAKVIVSDVDKEGGKETVALIEKAKGKAHFIACDVSRPKQCEKLVIETVKKYGALHIACNNAGIGGAQAPIGEHPIDDWQKTIAINLSGVFYGMHYQLPAILKAGGGAIVNIASILGQVGAAGSVAYVAAKHGIVGITQNAALEYSAKGVRINTVGPGYIKTPLLTNNLKKEQLKQLVQLHPIGRLGKAEEVAELVLWLSSEKASFVTGAYYAIDGGYLAQ